MLTAVARPNFAAGAFSLAIDSPAKNLAFIARMTNLRSRLLQLPYGDQALFTTRQMFSAIGGFAEIAIMEDFVFIQKLKEKRHDHYPPRVCDNIRPSLAEYGHRPDDHHQSTYRHRL